MFDFSSLQINSEDPSANTVIFAFLLAFFFAGINAFTYEKKNSPFFITFTKETFLLKKKPFFNPLPYETKVQARIKYKQYKFWKNYFVFALHFHFSYFYITLFSMMISSTL